MEHIENQYQSHVDLTALKEKTEQLRAEIGKVIVGQQHVVDLLLVALLSNGHVLLEGVPGVAKTLTAKLLAKMMHVPFKRIQFTPDLMPSDVLGTSVFNFQQSTFEFKRGPIFSNFVLIDEINRAPAKTQAALFEVMEERQITMDGTTYEMQLPFLVIATQNPIEQEGTYRLPEAQLDRFIFKVVIHYPNLQEEEEILRREQTRVNSKPLDVVQQVLNANEIEQLQRTIREIRVEDSLLQYISKIVHNTRTNKFLYLGASPRASVALLTSAKAFAALQGRDFVIPDDIKFVSNPVLRHRIVLSPDKEMEGITPDEVIQDIINSVEVPR